MGHGPGPGHSPPARPCPPSAAGGRCCPGRPLAARLDPGQRRALVAFGGPVYLRARLFALFCIVFFRYMIISRCFSSFLSENRFFGCRKNWEYRISNLKKRHEKPQKEGGAARHNRAAPGRPCRAPRGRRRGGPCVSGPPDRGPGRGTRRGADRARRAGGGGQGRPPRGGPGRRRPTGTTNRPGDRGPGEAAARRGPGPPTPQRGPPGEHRARADGGDGPPTGQAARSPRLRGRRDPSGPQPGPPPAPPAARPGPGRRERSPGTRTTGRAQPTQGPQPGARGAGVAGRGPHTFVAPPSHARRGNRDGAAPSWGG